MVSPMLATLADASLTDPRLVYEPKYDGIRAIVEVTPGRGGASVRIWSRNGNDKTSQFPVIAGALSQAGAKLKGPLVLDGEIVALDEHGRPAGFQRLQGRMHLIGARDIDRAEQTQPVALIAFDLLQDGDEDLCRLPLTARRERLERVAKSLFQSKHHDRILRVSDQVSGNATQLHARALSEGWEGLIAKDAASTYQAGRRSPAWRKIKAVRGQEFVVGGWTEPRQTRQYFGALLLGVYDDDALMYVGHTGTGFDQKELARVWKLLRPREIATSPFSAPIKTNEPAHWVRPELVAQVRFTEWTADDRLRHPVYLGLRDDKDAREVVREGATRAERPGPAPLKRRPTSDEAETAAAGRRFGGARSVGRGFTRAGNARSLRGARGPDLAERAALDALIAQLRTLEDARRDGELTLPNADRINVTNLAKVFWPAAPTPQSPKDAGLTKGDLLRYYVEVSPYLLPAIGDRPLVMKRFPNGIAGKAFYQQRSREERPPAGVRIESLPEGADPIDEDDARRLVGGSLTTLLYMTQIAAISQDPWFSRVQSPLDADFVAIDLDPTEGTPFERVVDVARWVRDELASLKVPGVPKTSGSRGLHIYIPLAPHTSYESGLLFCQIVATLVASRHPKAATVERTVARRPRGTVYVDFLQNILGKTLATAYSARATEFAGVSTPLEWSELDGKLDPRDFTIRTAPQRFRQVGDLWARLRTSTPADLEAVFRKYAPRP